MWFQRKRAEAQLNRELRYHYERLVRDSIAEGMEPEEARRRARLEFGGLEQIKEECRDVRGRWLDDFGKDLGYAARTLRRSPGFLAVSVLSLALGIGANTAVFSLINAVLLRSLPVRDPGRLVYITRVDPNGKPEAVSYPLFRYFRENLKSVQQSAAEMGIDAAIVMDGSDEVVSAELVSGEQYSMLGIQPVAGRLLAPADDVLAPESPAAVISYSYWRRRFGGDPAAVGKTFSLAEQHKVFTIVGVTPASYRGAQVGADPDITLPLTMMLSEENRGEPTNNMLDMMGRLAPGATREQANAELQVLWQGFLKRVAATLPLKSRPRFLAQRAAALRGANGFDPLQFRYLRALLMLMGIVALVLLLACANLSGLLLARAASREREISIRLAIGAGRGRLIRQFLTESFLLAVLGGGTGLLLAPWFSRTLVQMMAKGEKLTLPVAPDWRVLAFTGAVSLLACILAGLAPGLHAVRSSLNAGLRRPRAGVHRKLGQAMVITQLSISMVLVIGAALFAKTLVKLYGVDRGLQTDRILTFTVYTVGQEPAARVRTAVASMLDRLNATPGVASASAVDVLPISGSLWSRDVQVQGYTFRPDESEESAFNAIAPKYFATVGTPLLRGREFDVRDTGNSQKVTIVNESFARYFFGGDSPLGRTVTCLQVTYEIVGVVKDAKYTSLRQEAIKTMYIPWTQRTGEELTDFWFLARVDGGDPMLLAPPLPKLVRDAGPILRVRSPKRYSAVVDDTIATERIMAALGGFFGVLALVVACLGVFGVMAFQVSRRINEIGVRMALGSSQRGIVALVLREVVAMLAVGCLIGTGAALSLTGLTRAMLFGVRPVEPGLFVIAAAVLGVAALGAGWVPARRASRVDPMVALRCE